MELSALIDLTLDAVLNERLADADELLAQARNHPDCDGELADLLDSADSALGEDLLELVEDLLGRAMYAARPIS